MSKASRSAWYDYYAGYSQEFVHDILTYLSLPGKAVVLDPWNGTGTTTQLAEDMGLSAIGFDANPVMVVVAKARRLDSSVLESLTSLCADILKKAFGYRSPTEPTPEPLETWLKPKGAASFRKLECAIQELLIDQERYRSLYREQSLSAVSSLAAFYYLALFRTLRDTLAPFRSSNPTWIKTPVSPRDRLDPSYTQVSIAFERQVTLLSETVKHHKRAIPIGHSPQVRIEVASSTSIPLPDNTVDAVISSPPYCTRIDYVAATKPELALLGCRMETDIQSLRQSMIGTPTVWEETPAVQSAWGASCATFLDAVANHGSKASRSYYLKNYLQYFDSVYRSLTEVNRTLAYAGHCVLVVQDSFYKDVHNNLPSIFTDLGFSVGWTLTYRMDFVTARTMAGVNKRIQKYRSDATATESVLIFEKRERRGREIG